MVRQHGGQRPKGRVSELYDELHRQVEALPADRRDALNRELQDAVELEQLPMTYDPRARLEALLFALPLEGRIAKTLADDIRLWREEHGEEGQRIFAELFKANPGLWPRWDNYIKRMPR